MAWERHYICPTCKATKTLKSGSSVRSEGEFLRLIPQRVLCGWRGCSDYAIPAEKLTHGLDDEGCDICHGTGFDVEGQVCKRLMGD